MNAQKIYGEDCVCYENSKWVPENVADRFEQFYHINSDAPDYVNLCEACNQHHFNVNNPFETFLCGYLWKGARNDNTSKMLSDTNMKLINTMADNRVLSEKLEDMRKRLEQEATEYATFRNNVSESDWQRAINEKDAMIAQLQEYINTAQREYQYQLNRNNEEHNNEMRKKMNEKDAVIASLQNRLHNAEDEVNDFLNRRQAEHDEAIRVKTKEIADLRSKHLDEQIKDREDHFHQLSQKDDEIYRLRSDLANIEVELKKAKKEAKLSLLNANDKALNKELQLADNLTKFKRVTWSLLEKVLISYENTMLYIDGVQSTVKDCQELVNKVMSDMGNVIKNKFDQVSVPNVEESQASVKHFENKYLGDVKEEVEQVKRTYELDSLPSKRFDSFDTTTLDQSEYLSSP